MQRRHLLAGAGAWLAPGALLAPAAAHAATHAATDWPRHPLRLVVPFPPGSSPDTVARLLADGLAPALGQPVLVENKPGAGGNIGTGAVAKAAPDGQTWLFTIQGPLVTAPLLTRRLPYDPARDLAPVSLVATSPNVLVVDPRTGVDSVAGFVDAARRRAGAWNYGSVGNGSASHLAMAWFCARTRLDLVHVPYAGFPQVVNALLSGEVQAAFMVPGLAMAQVQAGRLRALGVTSLGRVASLPTLPPLAELGHPGFEAISWQAVLAPAGTPPALVDPTSRRLVRVVRRAAFRTRLLSQYFSAAGTTPDGLRDLIVSERARWAKVIRLAGVTPE